MALETGTFISDLVSTNPLGSDPLAFSDDHTRLIKATLKNTFPNVTGAVTRTHTELNTVNTAYDFRVPAGGIIMWSGAVVNIPTGWLLCNGLSGTPNLMDRFVVGAGSLYAVGALGGSKDAVIPSHNHTATLTGATTTPGSHTHSISDPGHRHVTNVPNEFAIGDVSTTGNQSSDGVNPLGKNVFTSVVATGISIPLSGDHAHSVTSSGSTDLAGVSAVNANLPPFFALAYIMKSA